MAYDHSGCAALGAFEAFFFIAYRAHAEYWLKDDTQAESCFGVFVPALYAG